jgi:hypothetical protein
MNKKRQRGRGQMGTGNAISGGIDGVLGVFFINPNGQELEEATDLIVQTMVRDFAHKNNASKGLGLMPSREYQSGFLQPLTAIVMPHWMHGNLPWQRLIYE